MSSGEWRPETLWKTYTIYAVVTIGITQVFFTWTQYFSGLTTDVRDIIQFQTFISLTSTNWIALIYFLHYTKKAAPTLSIFDRAAFVLGRAFQHQELKGLSQEEAANRLTTALDAFHQVRTILEGLGKIKPHHIERGVRM